MNTEIVYLTVIVVVLVIGYLVANAHAKKRAAQFPATPQPCPHCGVPIARAWVEFTGAEQFFVEHGEPVCRFGSKCLEVFPLTQREIQAFRYWAGQTNGEDSK